MIQHRIVAYITVSSNALERYIKEKTGQEYEIRYNEELDDGENRAISVTPKKP